MPYRSNADLPAPVKERYSSRCQNVFREAFNREHSRSKSEQRAFRVAHTAANNCKNSEKK